MSRLWGLEEYVSPHLVADGPVLNGVIRCAVAAWHRSLTAAGYTAVGLPGVELAASWDDLDEDARWIMRPRWAPPTFYALRIAGRVA